MRHLQDHESGGDPAGKVGQGHRWAEDSVKEQLQLGAAEDTHARQASTGKREAKWKRVVSGRVRVDAVLVPVCC